MSFGMLVSASSLGDVTQGIVFVGAMFIYISTASPNRASLGATNGLSQAGSSYELLKWGRIHALLGKLDDRQCIQSNRSRYSKFALFYLASKGIHGRLHGVLRPHCHGVVLDLDWYISSDKSLGTIGGGLRQTWFGNGFSGTLWNNHWRDERRPLWCKNAIRQLLQQYVQGWVVKLR